MAERTGTAVLLVRHFNKSNGTSPLYRGAGSIGLIGAVRSGLLVAVDPSDPDRRVLAQSKTNLSSTPDSLSFRPVPRGESAAVEWLGSQLAMAAAPKAVER
jgi:putative DNA primase/helicase